MAQETNARPFERVHFIGIGGAGMSGIALVLHQRGFHVTGSDLKASKYTRALVKEGIEVFVGHHARTIDEVKPDVVVISTAIPQSNPELVRARELGIEVWHRAKMLSFLSGDAITIACAGTHGKTTTSSLAATMLERMNLKPTFLIGGIIDGYETNGNSGEGPYFVAEADESDGSFLNLDPNVVIVTNIEADHLDHYGSLEAIEKTFVQFMGSVPEDGHVIVCGENPHVPELARSCGRPVLTYGFGEGNDVVCTPKEGEGVNAFSVRLPDGNFLTTPTGTSKAILEPGMIIKMNAANEVVEPAALSGYKPTSEFKVHLRCYAERPEVNAVVHAHPPTATGFAIAHIPLDDYTMPEAIIFLGSVPIAPYDTPGSVGVADSIIPFLAHHDTILMENHGALTVGVDITQAYYRMETLEHFAKVSLVARQLGGAHDLPMDKIQECCDIAKSFPIRHPGYRKYSK